MTTTTFTAIHLAQAKSLTVKTQIRLPWRLLAIGFCLFGAADIVATEGLSAAGTAMFFTAYFAFSASLTMFFTKAGRSR